MEVRVIPMETITPKYHRILLKISGEALAGDKKT